MTEEGIIQWLCACLLCMCIHSGFRITSEACVRWSWCLQQQSSGERWYCCRQGEG